MDITGRWKAYYRYGAGYDLPEFEQKVEHTIEIEVTPEGFIGKSSGEVGHGAVPEIGDIVGKVEDDFVEFVKTYPRTYMIDHEGNSSLESENPFHVSYQGYVDQYHEKIYGEWTIRSLYIEEDGSEIESVVFGTWMWYRED